MNLVVVMGPPGSGKGTQCARLVETVGCVHLSLGSMLRDEVDRESPLGSTLRSYLTNGVLVPDELAADVIANALEQHASASTVLLDGFPRTVAQAQLLERLAPPSVAVCLELVVPVAVLLRRLAARGRDDDVHDVLRRRLAQYSLKRWPLAQWYASRGLLAEIDGNRHPDHVAASITRVLTRVGVPFHVDDSPQFATDCLATTAANSVRDETSSFVKTCLRWVPTV